MGSVWATDREEGKGCRRLRGGSSARERVETGLSHGGESGNGAAAALKGLAAAAPKEEED